MVGGSFHRRERFDPWLILSQIVLIQAVFYLSMRTTTALIPFLLTDHVLGTLSSAYLRFLVIQTCTLLIFNWLTGTTISIFEQIFNQTYVTLHHLPGIITSGSLVFACAVPTAIAFTMLVGRAKRSADFACTLFVSHTIATTVHSGFPTSTAWWFTNIFAIIALATVGETLSMRQELNEIPMDDLVSKAKEKVIVQKSKSEGASVANQDAELTLNEKESKECVVIDMEAEGQGTEHPFLSNSAHN